MNNFPVEQSLFDDLPETKGTDTALRKLQTLELPQIEDVGSYWSDDFEQLEDLIGSEAALKVAEVFAGSTIYIPKNILINKNYHHIRKKFKAGSSYRELSLEFGYTETHIRNIIHKK